MKPTFRFYFTAILMILMISSCTGYKKIPYMENAAALEQTELAKTALNYEAKAMPGDILLVTVNTLTPEAAKDFNLPLIPQSSKSIVPSEVNSATENYGSLQNYIVDNSGYINFPVLGKIKVAGLTKAQVEKLIHDAIYPAYTTENPIVTMRFLNYRVTVLGEVNKPGIYTSENARMTIFDAIASAEDLTIYGKRDKILLVRLDENGEKHIYPVNLQDRSLLLNNDIYYLQQNDLVYVEPNKTKGNNSQIGALESLTLSGISLLVSVIAIIIR
ncbi:MAG: yccZ [Bacteroidetes bacterium]|jgi:polysaccharide biosynthesis/export protein|nr:yccZ [Bacteroidota bacterium]